MTKITNFVCVNEVSSDENGQLLLSGPITKLVLETLPNNFSFFVVFSLIEMDWEKDTKHYARLTVNDPNQETVFDSGKIEIPLVDDSATPFNDISANFSMNNLRFGTAGIHEVTLQIDDEIQNKTYFVIENASNNQ